MRAALDLFVPAPVSAGVLVDDFATRGSVGPSDVTVGIAGDVRQHMSDRPSRETRWTPDISVVKVGDRMVEALLRVVDPVQELDWRGRGPVHAATLRV